jgi:hemerythrin-like domain-containing protein
MSVTAKYREHHHELLSLAGQISPLLDAGRLAADAGAVRQHLNNLAAKLKIHLAMEDSALYPRLLKHADGSVRSKTQAFMDEMGGIKRAFEAYLDNWSTAQAIQARSQAFIEDTQGLLKILGQRIKKEDDDLYAMVDRLG